MDDFANEGIKGDLVVRHVGLFLLGTGVALGLLMFFFYDNMNGVIQLVSQWGIVICLVLGPTLFVGSFFGPYKPWSIQRRKRQLVLFCFGFIPNILHVIFDVPLPHYFRYIYLIVAFLLIANTFWPEREQKQPDILDEANPPSIST